MCVLVAPVVLKLTPELAGILLSPEEFDTIEDCDELYNYELVHGVLVVAPPPDIGEREPNEQLGHLLRSYQDQHPQGATLNLTVSEHSIRTPDSRRRADRVIWTGLGRDPRHTTRSTHHCDRVCVGQQARFSAGLCCQT